MVKIQELNIGDIDSETMKIEITIADSPNLEKRKIWLVANLPVPRQGLSLENVASSTLGQLRELIEQAANQIDMTLGGTA